MSRYSHHSRNRMSMTKHSISNTNNQTTSNKINNNNDSDEDENVIGPPKLSNFGSALLNETLNNNNNSRNTNYTKFHYFKNNKTNILGNTKYPSSINGIRRAATELEETTSQEMSSPSSSSSIFANTINQTSIRPTSMTTFHNSQPPTNNETETLQRLKQSMVKDESAMTDKILERRNNRRLSRNSSNHSTLNFNSSLNKDIEISGTITSNNDYDPLPSNNVSDSLKKIQTLQQNLKEEVTSKYVERRNKRFLNIKRMSRLGPAKRASEVVVSDLDLSNTHQSKDDINDNQNIIDDRNINKENNQLMDDSKSNIDYSSIVFGDLNPFQYVKKHNIPTTELPQISKIYFERQKEENRLIAMRKRSLASTLNQKRITEVSNRNSERSNGVQTAPFSNIDQITNLDEIKQDKENITPIISRTNDDRGLKKREALSTLNINKREPEFKRIKSDPEQLKQMVNEENNHRELHKNKPVKKVEIQEPTASKRYHKHDNQQNNNNGNNRNPMILVNDTEYEKVELLGRGGSSKVYKVKGPSNKVYALKRVAFDEFDDSSIDGFKGEIALLEKLRNQDRVVKLFDYEMNSGVLYLIMECGDYDLSFMLNQKLKLPIDVEFIRYYAREMIKCVKVVHEADIVHSDLKPANFVFVKGMLKIIDFGIANAVPDHTVNIYRETQIGTPNYMAPEALVAMNYTNDNSGQTGNRWKVGKPSDVWSIGCIIYQMIYGKPPYAGFQGQNRLLAIMNPEVKIMYPDKTSKDEIVPRSAIDLMKECLHRDPNKRLTTEQMLNTEFFNPIMVSESFIRNLIKNAVYFGCEQGDVSDGKIDDLATDVINRLSEFRI